MEALLMEISTLGDGLVGMVLGVLFIIWCVLMFFAPFFWFGTNSRTKQTARALKELALAVQETNTILQQIRDGEYVDAPAEEAQGDTRGYPGRAS